MTPASGPHPSPSGQAALSPWLWAALAALVALALAWAMGWGVPSGASAQASPATPQAWRPAMAGEERAILAGGCFWGVQELIRQEPGVLRTRVGYTGGEVPNATYRNHGNHAEALEVVFDPKRLSYRDLLALFFQIHDPTTANRQGNDVGASYRSAIFFTSPEQERVARETIEDVNRSGLWPGPAVTELKAAGPFWEAEPEHQDYLQRIPNGYTCHFPRPGWKLPPHQPKP